MKKKLLAECLRISQATLSKHPEKRFKHWCFIIQDNKILEWSTNSSGIPPVHFGYHNRLRNAEIDPKLHAEFNAFKKARGIINSNKKWECVNVRLSSNGEMRTSTPCECCYSFLTEMGCNTIWFTTNFGWAKCH